MLLAGPLAAADLHPVRLQKELLFGGTGRHKPQNVAALGHFLHLPGGYNMCLLDDLDVIAGLEGPPVRNHGGMGISLRQDCPTCFYVNFYPFVSFCCHSLFDVTFTTSSVLLHSRRHGVPLRRKFHLLDEQSKSAEDSSLSGERPDGGFSRPKHVT